MKMPEPIIDPMTSVVESSSPRPAIRLLALALLMRPYCTLSIFHALADGCRLAAHVEGLGRLALHAIGQLERLDARFQLRVMAMPLEVRTV